ncbi:MAG TPA: ethanolamine ammonia-lyase subunit EutC [Lacipirellulaceae bacterium]|nr:ethanolamine ammonia-lyase subunit EutC [Lacipirellulaceae bacterium]
MERNTLITRDPWTNLKSATPARIALGRAGGSLPTREWLDFKSAHAAARDAVHCAFDAERLAADLRALGVEVVAVDSAAGDRHTYLQRPDLGRRLDERSRYKLQELPRPQAAFDLAIIVSDGLSALAVKRQAVPLLSALLQRLRAGAWRLAPIVVARFGRVALQDEVGQVLSAHLALMLIGERPGLGSPDSLGAYLVYNPAPGNTDANRNCVSNIRPEGLPHEAAAETIHYLLTEARRRRLSGVQLKDQRALS